MPNNIAQSMLNAVSDGLHYIAKHNTSNAKVYANNVSRQAQATQGAFNQGSVNIANDLASNRILDQYGYNSAQASLANDFTMGMWDRAAEWNEMMWQKSADWNEKMWQKQADFNSAEAQKNRDWQQQMAETAYQRAVKDMAAAGLNPILATGGVGASAGGSGSAASVGGSSISAPSMSGAQGQAASGGLLNGLSASEGMYSGQGQLDYLGAMLGLLGSAIGAIGSAQGMFNQLGTAGNRIGSDIMDIIANYYGNESYNKEHGRFGSKTGETIKKYTDVAEDLAGMGPIKKAIEATRQYYNNHK